MLGAEHGTVAAVDLGGPDPVLAGQGLDQRPLHDVLQQAEPVTVERQLVVLRDAPELGLELGDDTEIGIGDAFGAPDRLAVVQVGRALGADDAERHFQPDRRVDAAVTALIMLVIGVQDHDLIAEEPGSLRPPVSDQGLGCGQFQLELIMQELPDAGLDLLGFPPGTGETQQPVVRVAAVGQPPVARIAGVA